MLRLVVEDVIFAFDSLVLGNFVAFDGENFKLFFFFVWISIILDEWFEILNIFKAVESI